MTVAELLKDCPRGTRLYAIDLGDVMLDSAHTEHTYRRCAIKVVLISPDRKYMTSVYDDEGYLLKGAGERLLFPSKENRDWTTFDKEKTEIHPLYEYVLRMEARRAV